ncbi:hypothetical protein CK203_009225 [Vitis vinifera]|uniref:Uncharacterized protein n=1 Tax=Vitis vinifera TaxID=29760 RepID=A0A438K2M4_VITVI|nr:hypothetical protein CK203_076818 [Vitis vinifera]RVX15443.1 hypothetical protein CK203_009225 [Vitis vinifera]
MAITGTGVYSIGLWKVIRGGWEAFKGLEWLGRSLAGRLWNLGFTRQFQDWELHNFEELLMRLQVLGKWSKDDDKLI